MTQSNDPDQIRREIAETRANLSQDVNALADEARPGNVARRQVDKVTDGARGLKDRIMGSDDRGLDQYEYHDNGPGVGDRARDARDQAGEQARQVGYQAREAGRQAGYQARQAGRQARDGLQQTPDRVRRQTQGNPLAAGLIAFGVGALIGGLAPVTRREQQAVAGLADRAQPMVEQARGVAQEMTDNMREPAQQAVANVKGSAVDSAQTLQEQGKGHAQDIQGHAQDAKGTVQDH